MGGRLISCVDAAWRPLSDKATRWHNDEARRKAQAQYRCGEQSGKKSFMVIPWRMPKASP